MLNYHRLLSVLSIFSVIYSIYGIFSNQAKMGFYIGVLILSLIILGLSTGILSLNRIKQTDNGESK